MSRPTTDLQPPSSRAQYRFRGSVAPRPGIRASILRPTVVDGEATLRVLDPIDSWGGDWGVSAKEFAVALDAIPADVATINLHINSPGGEVWEALTMVNLLRAHDAKVVSYVDGLAASSASFLAASADEVVMMPDTKAMIHDAWGLSIGNANDMRDYGELLDRVSNTIAGVYAHRGGTVEEWRAAMLAESWYSAEEAVAAGLADRVADLPKRADDPAPADAFDLSVFKFAGRSEAPNPGTHIPAPDPDPVTVDPEDLADGEWRPGIAARFRELSLREKAGRR